jgi:predicted AAA+ superfamily ATPase
MIKRKAYSLVLETMNNKQIPILMGLRRTGKTTILQQINKENKFSFIVNFDDISYISYTDIEIMDYLKSLINSGIKILLLDEIQVRKK